MDSPPFVEAEEILEGPYEAVRPRKKVTRPREEVRERRVAADRRRQEDVVWEAPPNWDPRVLKWDPDHHVSVRGWRGIVSFLRLFFFPSFLLGTVFYYLGSSSIFLG